MWVCTSAAAFTQLRWLRWQLGCKEQQLTFGTPIIWSLSDRHRVGFVLDATSGNCSLLRPLSCAGECSG